MAIFLSIHWYPVGSGWTIQVFSILGSSVMFLNFNVLLWSWQDAASAIGMVLDKALIRAMFPLTEMLDFIRPQNLLSDVQPDLLYRCIFLMLSSKQAVTFIFLRRGFCLAHIRAWLLLCCPSGKFSHLYIEPLEFCQSDLLFISLAKAFITIICCIYEHWHAYFLVCSMSCFVSFSHFLSQGSLSNRWTKLSELITHATKPGQQFVQWLLQMKRLFH